MDNMVTRCVGSLEKYFLLFSLRRIFLCVPQGNAPSHVSWHRVPTFLRWVYPGYRAGLLLLDGLTNLLAVVSRRFAGYL